jgi:hypothetical protein
MFFHTYIGAADAFLLYFSVAGCYTAGKFIFKIFANPKLLVLHSLPEVSRLFLFLKISCEESSKRAEREPVPRVPHLLPGLPTEHLPWRQILEQVRRLFSLPFFSPHRKLPLLLFNFSFPLHFPS